MRDSGKRDPSSHRTPAQIRKMNKTYDATPEHRRGRSMRNKARRIMQQKYGKAALRGKDVDHIKRVVDGGTNAISNLRLRPPHLNRGWERYKR